MQSTIKFYVVLTFLISFLPLNDAYIHGAKKEMKEKFIDMERELVMDVMAKMTEIENIRLKESRTTAYRQGELAYHTRRKWSLMLRIYFKCVQNNQTMTNTELIQDMIALQRLNMDIYHSTENMHQLEDDGEEVPIDEDQRRSGTRRDPRFFMRRNLFSAYDALREKYQKQSERMHKIYQRTSSPPFDISRQEKFLSVNASEVLLPIREYTGKYMDYDPEFFLPFLVK